MRRGEPQPQMRAPSEGLLHEAFVHHDDGAFVERVARFLRDGIEEGPTIAVFNRRHRQLLGEELDAEAERVSFRDSDELYVRPIDALASYDATLRQLTDTGSTSFRVAAEISLGPTSAGWGDWISYEAILNRMLADRPLHLLCVYDAKVAPDAVIDAVWQTHPHVDADGVGADYHEPSEVVAAFTPTPARELVLPTLPMTHDANAFREQVSAALAAARAPREKVMNMLLAANEVFDNALRHGGGPSSLRAGLVDDWFVCEVEDRGPGLDDPFAGYLPPGQPGRAGLWVARQLVSRLELLPGEPGLTARLWL